jgi:hypothetical protein
VLASADTYLHIARVLRWDPDRYEQWIVTTWTRLAAGAG